MRIEILRQMTDDELMLYDYSLQLALMLICNIPHNKLPSYVSKTKNIYAKERGKVKFVQQERKQPHDEVQFYE